MRSISQQTAPDQDTFIFIEVAARRIIANKEEEDFLDCFSNYEEEERRK